MGRITHRKIAQLAGVSQSSVSKALAGSLEISEETAKKIRRIATENGYYDQKKEKRTNSRFYRPYIAILVPEIISLNYAQQATMLIRALDGINADGRIYVTGFEPDEIDRVTQSVLQSDFVDGVVSFSMKCPMEGSSIPFLSITQTPLDLPGHMVCNNFAGGLTLAIRHLTSLGHSRIGFVGETKTQAKAKIFTELMKEHGLEADYVYTNDFRFETCGYNAVLQMLDSDRLFPTALICAYDEIAYGVINELKLYGYGVPKDFSVIGINDVAFSKIIEPGLTSIVLHSDEICTEAVKLMESCLRGESGAIKHIEVQCSLALRESTGEPRKTPLV